MYKARIALNTSYDEPVLLYDKQYKQSHSSVTVGRKIIRIWSQKKGTPEIWQSILANI